MKDLENNVTTAETSQPRQGWESCRKQLRVSLLFGMVALGCGFLMVCYSSTHQQARPPFIYEVREQVCEGQPASSPEVGLAEDEPGKASFGRNEFSIPEELQATELGHFRYAVCLKEEIKAIERCALSLGNLTRFTYRRRILWHVTVRDTRTANVVHQRTFYGSQPPLCPLRAKETEFTDKIGDAPLGSEVSDWLESVLR